MQHSINTFAREGFHFKREFRRQIRMMIVVTLGFTIAFTWRQTVFDISKNFVELITHVQGSAELSILTSTFITILSLFFIFLSSHFLNKD